MGLGAIEYAINGPINPELVVGVDITSKYYLTSIKYIMKLLI